MERIVFKEITFNCADGCCYDFYIDVKCGDNHFTLNDCLEVLSFLDELDWEYDYYDIHGDLICSNRKGGSDEF